MNTLRIKSADNFPPLPWPSSTLPLVTSGVGQVIVIVLFSRDRAKSQRLMPPVLVIGGAGSFGRYHGRAQRFFGSAAIAERGAIDRLFEALQHQCGDACRWFL